jgi:hypothetical protein
MCAGMTHTPLAALRNNARALRAQARELRDDAAAARLRATQHRAMADDAGKRSATAHAHAMAAQQRVDAMGG